MIIVKITINESKNLLILLGFISNAIIVENNFNDR